MRRRTTGDVSAACPTAAAAGGAAVGTGGVAGAGVAIGSGVKATTGAGAGGTIASGRVTGSGGAAGRGSGPAVSPMTPSTVPTAAVAPSGTRMSVRTPARAAGTSVSTLSVETSKSGSSASTWSPICLSHRVIVPSVTVSPSCGMVMFTNVSCSKRA